LNKAIPPGFNFNPSLYDAEYYEEVEKFIVNTLEPALLNGQIHYIVWCHGADSHKEDQLGAQCSTEWWMKCADFFWGWVREMDAKLGRYLPVSCSLFGGYRDDDFNSVLSLHTGDLMSCVKHCLEVDVNYQVVVKPRKGR
jgi:acetoin utilization deacetylase AcuC-like enzyme